jgi:hypothetical protein
MENIKTVLIELITASYEAQKRFLEKMSDDARLEVGKVDDWSPKDVLAHVVHWDTMMAKDIGEAETKQPEQGQDFNRTNARIWEQNKDRSWQELEAQMDQTHQVMVANLSRMSEDDLLDTERFEWLGGRALWRSVAFTCHYHALQHLAVIYANFGDVAYGDQIQEEAAQQQLRLLDTDDWRGTVYYNLGCYYALSGQRELYPVLANWAPDDSDLVLLHGDQEFEDLIERVRPQDRDGRDDNQARSAR